MKGLPYVYFCFFIVVIAFIERRYSFTNIVHPELTVWILVLPILLFVLMKQEIQKGKLLYPFVLLVMHNIFLIFIFAGLYELEGINGPYGCVKDDALQAIYFSVVTWTTLGYGDYQPVAHMQIYAAIEALMGYTFLGVLIGFVSNWLFTISSSEQNNKRQATSKNKK